MVPSSVIARKQGSEGTWGFEVVDIRSQVGRSRVLMGTRGAGGTGSSFSYLDPQFEGAYASCGWCRNSDRIF